MGFCRQRRRRRKRSSWETWREAGTRATVVNPQDLECMFLVGYGSVEILRLAQDGICSIRRTKHFRRASDRSTRPHLQNRRTTNRLNLEDVSFAGDDFIEHRVDEETEQEAREQAGYHDDGEWFLGVAADAGRHGGGEQAEAGDEGRHHDGAKAEERSAESCFANGFTFEAELVDVAD